jgi:phage gp45-like
VRTTLTDAAHRAQNSTARATIREVDDNHLVQEVKYADVFHSETPSNFERLQPIGLTAVPLKQDPSQKPTQVASASGSVGSGTNNQAGEFNHDQPTEPSAEAIMTYVNGQRSHPVATMTDDRRVRPYKMKPGQSALYAADGSEQMVFIKDTGTQVVSLDGPAYGSKEKKTRYASLRHVTKPMQPRKIDPNDKSDYPHEGKTVNTEIRCIADRIEFRAGDTVVGYYEKSSETWYFKGKIAQMEFTQEIDTTAPKVNVNVSNRFQTYGAGRTMLGLDVKDDEDVKVDETVGGPAKKTFAKV